MNEKLANLIINISDHNTKNYNSTVTFYDNLTYILGKAFTDIYAEISKEHDKQDASFKSIQEKVREFQKEYLDSKKKEDEKEHDENYDEFIDFKKFVSDVNMPEFQKVFTSLSEVFDHLFSANIKSKK